MAVESPPQNLTAEAPVQKRRTSAAQRLTELSLALSTRLIFDGENAYAVIQMPDHVRTLPIESQAFRRWASAKMVEQGNGVPSGEAIRAAQLTLAGLAEGNGISDAPTIRVTGHNKTIYIDLGDDSWRCVRVDAQGWEVVPHRVEGPYMYRPPKQAALPLPQHGGDVHELWSYVNVTSDADKWLVLAWLIQTLWPHGPYPLLAVYGEHGAAKTSLMCALKALVDPTRPSKEAYAPTSLSQPPREIRDIAAKAYSARVLGFDNVSMLDNWLSDALCRLATGADLGGRALFSNFDEATFSAVRPVMLNGIPDVVGQTDLADRTIKIEAHIPPARIEEAKLWRAFENARPRILGGLLDLLSQVLANFNDAIVPGEYNVRMADFARIGEAMGYANGWAPGAFTAMYYENRQSAAREIAEHDPITVPLRAMLANTGGEWRGTLTALLSELTARTDPGTRGRYWPKSARSLSGYLRRLNAALKALGIEITKGRERGESGNTETIYIVRQL